MTSSLIRGRPRRTGSPLCARLVQAVLGGAIAVLWLVLPAMTTDTGTRPGPGASAAVRQEDGTHTADLVLPLIAALAAVAVAAYGYTRRTRRARTRTTPGGVLPGPPPVPSLETLDRQSRLALVEADDCVRTSREELAFAEAGFPAADGEPFVRALRAAGAELSAAFRMRQRCDEGVPREESARRQALAGIVGRCAEAGRRLDAEAAGFDVARGLEQGAGTALEVAEGRFRELTGRTAAAETALAELAERYPPGATDAVVGNVEQAKDRLVFATARLNEARRAADSGAPGPAAGRLRAAEGAIAQAGVLVDGVERLARELTTAAGTVPAALTGAEAEIAGVREWLGREPGGEGRQGSSPAVPEVPVGELRARLAHADTVLASVREERTAGPYDPLDALRRIVRAVAPLTTGRAGVLPAAAALVAHSATAVADGFVTTHRAAVGATARTRLAAAEDILDDDPLAADAFAREARDLAERDVRAHGTPQTGPDAYEAGAGGAVLGGILLGDDRAVGPPASFGGPRTRARRTTNAP
ncbi:hypothetical protein [Streptomyces cadmiisoli]|uniref:TPM domain-containing protein n=2 Tax=Streptomyces TaxID=1883 RepID=A0A2Z4IY96_9ACTN|nr:hypothetical protein [Streptomyces sp. AS58]AWW37775.1 hypothetical protein DN051_14870 [Streptomyces cadmiisoli]